ncbi:MAG: G5 domain-containing protein [Oscillospiraceae bacterium]|nr:G5 domain-containing protein [Oscillospiraceae bacterium]
MIETQKQGSRRWSKRLWQAAFVMLLAAVVLLETVPGASANTLGRLADGLGGQDAERVDADRIMVAGAENDTQDVVLGADKKVTIHHDGAVRYATSREDEKVSELLQREGVVVGELELVRVTLSETEAQLDIGSNFTYYEVEQESADYTTEYTTDYTLAKGETRVVREGVPGTRDVTYEVVYADGEFISRQAIAEGESNAVPELIAVGTRVNWASDGDTIAEVIKNEDGSGYLIMASGDSMHFSHTMDVKCTAYTTGYDSVGTITYTGTTVHTGVVAVDKSVIPLGSTMFITTANGDFTYGMGHAEDTGVKGKVVDLFMNTYNECIQFGRRSSILYFID